MKMIPNYDYKNIGTQDVPFWREFANKTGKGFIDTRGQLSPSYIYDNLSKGTGNNIRFALSTKNHSLVLQSVTKTSITKLSGSIVTRYSYGVMDPAYGAFKSINPDKIFNIFQIRK